MTLSIKIAENEEDKKGVYSVRYKVFCQEMGFLDPGLFKDELEIDEFDHRSIHFAAIREDRVIGTARLICNKEGELFPAEMQDQPLPPFVRERAVEISRGALLPEFKNLSSITLRVLDHMYEYCKEKSYLHILAFANMTMFGLYKKLDVPFEFVGETVLFHGFETTPLIFSVKEDFHILKRRG